MRSAVILSILVCTSPAIAGNRALLIGCTEYPSLPRRMWLQGPANDVELFTRLLTSDRFGFDPKSITALAGWPKDESKRPTHANIASAFDRLTAEAERGDQIVILFSGHGSQQPADDDPDDRETDGFDEVFLPADAAAWEGDGNVNRVRNAIPDDMIRGWLTKLEKKGAFVWVLFDSCHSGTMIRGATEDVERERRIDPSLLLPAEVVRKAARGAPKSRSGAMEASTADMAEYTDAAPGIVAMYAAQSSEPTFERPLPNRGDDPHGIFTFTLAQVMFQASSALTYRELAERVVAHYRGAGRFQPTPLIEGRSLDRAVLGTEDWPDRPDILVRRDYGKGEVGIAAGYLHGIRPGSVLAVYPPAGARNADTVIGHLVVERARALRAIAVPTDFAGMPPQEKTPDGARCRVVFVDFGHLRSQIALQSLEGQTLTTHPAGEGPEAILGPVKEVVDGTRGLLTWADNESEAD